MKIEEGELTLPAEYSLDKKARLLAAHYDNVTEMGEGIFFNFKATPEIEAPVLDYLTNYYNWVLEAPSFIRKMED